MNKMLLLFAALLLCMTSQAQELGYRVVELHQAPGQFINVLPDADEETTQKEVCMNAQMSLAQNSLVSLGTYGGYITIKFDEPVKNLRGSDFLVLGNGFYAASDPVYGSETIGGSIEPGIVYVGVGDSPESAQWYELAGSEYFSSEIHDFSITYYKPTDENQSNNYIRWQCTWTDKDGTPRDSAGYHPKNAFHDQSYWPMYENKDKLTFMGGKLPNNAIDQSGKGTYWVQYRYSADSYGYVDACLAKDSIGSSFDIDWAVDKQGFPVHLDHIDFVRVSTGIFQTCGWLGETSTEVVGFANLHLIPGYDANPYIITPRPNPNDPLSVSLPQHTSANVQDKWFTLTGQRVDKLQRGKIYVHNGKKVVF